MRITHINRYIKYSSLLKILISLQFQISAALGHPTDLACCCSGEPIGTAQQDFFFTYYSFVISERAVTQINLPSKDFSFPYYSFVIRELAVTRINLRLELDSDPN